MITDLSRFSYCIEQMANSKFIFAERKISNLLASITESENLYATMQYCLHNFDYELEFLKAKLQNEGDIELILPIDEKRTVAFVFCLLCQFDQKTLNIAEFMVKYFSNDVHEGYNLFCEKMLVPFENALYAIVRAIEEGNC